jgi:dihydrofolate reductase
VSVRVSLIVAMASNRVIGAGNQMPWHLSADLKRFRAITWGKPILMGRKTHESIGRPLPGRQNLVLTTDPTYRAEGCTVVHSLEQARRALPPATEELMIIGGASLYAAFLPSADRLYLTLIHREFPGDVFFPPYDPEAWREIERIDVADDPSVDFAYSFLTLENARNA